MIDYWQGLRIPSFAELNAMSKEKSFEQEMEDEALSAEEHVEFLARHIEGYKKTVDDFLQQTDSKQRFFDMPRASVAYYMLGFYNEARGIANEMKALPKAYSGTWNDGNLAYYSNWIFGMLALDAGKVETSKELLLLSGECGGSPQLNSFGPNMRLAKRLLERGEKETFLEFLDLIERFWKNGENWLTIWREVVEKNREPNCLMHIF